MSLRWLGEVYFDVFSIFHIHTKFSSFAYFFLFVLDLFHDIHIDRKLRVNPFDLNETEASIISLQKLMLIQLYPVNSCCEKCLFRLGSIPERRHGSGSIVYTCRLGSWIINQV